MFNTYTAETLNAVRDILIQSAKFSRVYWWRPQATANSRREMEREESRPTVEWDESGHHYTARFDVMCYYGHTEAKGYYTKDGKRTNATAIRNSVNRMERDLKMAEMESELCEDC